MFTVGQETTSKNGNKKTKTGLSLNETQNYGQVPSPEGEFDRESVGFGAFDSLVDYATNGLGITKDEKKPKKLSTVNGEFIDFDKPADQLKISQHGQLDQLGISVRFSYPFAGF